MTAQPPDDSAPTPQFGDYQCGTGTDKSAAFVAGAARGLRTFRIDPDGWLRGVSYRQPWTPGENTAQCFAGKPNKLPRGMPKDGPPAYSSLGAYAFPMDASLPPLVMRGYEPNPCKGLDPACACGFYAYHVPDMARYGTGGNEAQATGVVEAYGKLVLGPFGYRAEKARIIALVVDTKLTGQQAAQLEQMRDAIAAAGELLRSLTIGSVRLGRNPRRMVYLGIVLSGAAAVVPGIAPLAMAVIGAITTLAVGSEVADRKFLAAARAEVQRAAQSFQREVDDVMTAVRRRGELPALVAANYPGIPIYDSTEAMLEAHPVEGLADLLNAGDDE